MYIVIAGGGRVGMSLASFLISDEQDVTLIESDENRCNQATAELDAVIIYGNCTDEKILEDANINEADVFVAVTGNDEINLLACIMVKEYNVSKIFSRVSEPSHEKFFKKIGIDSVISPEITTARYLEKLILRPKIADLVIMGKGDAELLDFTVDSEKSIGKRVGDLSPTDDFSIVAIYDNGNIVIPKPDMMLKEGMKVSILVKTKFAQDVLKRFTKLS
ncbi:MAG: potassium channel family protein [Methanobacterium sp.]